MALSMAQHNRRRIFRKDRLGSAASLTVEDLIDLAKLFKDQVWKRTS